MTHQDKKLMCTSLDCPERTGGECNFEIPLLEELLAEFDKFIKKWCPSWKHLIDCDENDGQRYRERLEDTFERIKEEGRREGIEEATKMLEKYVEFNEKRTDKFVEVIDKGIQRIDEAMKS